MNDVIHAWMSNPLLVASAPLLLLWLVSILVMLLAIIARR